MFLLRRCHGRSMDACWERKRLAVELVRTGHWLCSLAAWLYIYLIRRVRRMMRTMKHCYYFLQPQAHVIFLLHVGQMHPRS